MRATLLIMNELQSSAAALNVLRGVLGGIDATDLDNPTPCSEYDVSALTDHLLRSVALLGSAAGAQLPERDPDASVELQVIPAATAALQAWERRGVEGDIDFGPQPFPARLVVGIMALEYLVHAWDYGTAVGADVPVPDDVARAVLGLAQQVITPEGRKRAGFDDPVDVAGHAPAMDRLIAFTGRRP
jgi:uncharacterized protein (TIGR03086 family)